MSDKAKQIKEQIKNVQCWMYDELYELYTKDIISNIRR